MPRPKKWRIVEIVPTEFYFVPQGKPMCELGEEVLKVEEIEAVRLKDLEDLNQDQCAEKMQVSRQTFQRILGQARTKIAGALIEGKALRVNGGDFTRNVCRVYCGKCEQEWEDTYEKYYNTKQEEYRCPRCGSNETFCCNRKKPFCQKCCKKR
jgi:predicted DNA-binding protein (UPF0251 family)